MTTDPLIQSCFALGRKSVREHLQKHGSVTVSAYKNSIGNVFYAGPVNPERPPKNSVMYRIRIKERVQ